MNLMSAGLMDIAEPKRATVWLVEDSAMDAARAAKSLRNEYDLRLFGDPAPMLEQLTTGPAPDVLVLDWMLPGMSGPEICSFVRSQSDTLPHIGLLLLTARQQTDQLVEGLAAGADDYLRKPYDDQELVARVGALVRTKRLLERAEGAEARVRFLLAASPDALLVIGTDGMIAYANSEAQRLLTGGTNDLRNKRIADIVPALKLSPPHLDKGAALPDLRVGDRVLAPAARVYPGETESVIVTLRDVTQRRHEEEERVALYRVVAHDLRSPLSAILLRTDMVLRGKRGLVSPDLLGDVRKIDRTARSLVGLVNDFLDLAKLESGVSQIAHDPLDLAAVVRQAADDFRPLVAANNVELRLVKPSGEVRVVGDRMRLRQAVANLIENAVKFTPSGGTIAVEVRTADGQVEVSVEDTGPGIATEMLPVLFNRYSRSSGPTRVVGTGLGLMIVRQVVEAHHGRIGVESMLGKGSRFWFRIPERELPETAPASASQ